MSKISPKILLEGDKMFQKFHGALAENYVAQELISTIHSELYYWTSQGKAEVDFIVPLEDGILPMEVKAGLIRGAKSLHIYDQAYHPKKLIRISSRNLKQDGRFCNVPLYMVAPYLVASIRDRGRALRRER
jgi:hypothetical protein